MPAKLSRNAQVMKFFVQQAESGLGRTKLQKLVYLADLESRRLRGRPITSFDYVWHHHGPFDQKLYRAMDELLSRGVAVQEEVVYAPEYVEKRLVDNGTPVALRFSPAEEEILSFVARKFIDTPLQELLWGIVYETSPMKAVERKGDRLPVEIVDNEEKDRLGFDLDELMAGVEAVESGDYLKGSDFFDGLRATAQ